ncbi:hypothetical protein [Streptomyces sp. PA03-2a]|uniref:hypothetical protein n=1 Tax=Streptomyces sp. PA03-2a TaxID=3028701 RepID=UPI0029A4112F|nr:hypothetical protein [Streptomyces sp. PA03-2a]MDX2731186.1 hypothetical protein [Streptomyces sp. PA03-2a]
MAKTGPQRYPGASTAYWYQSKLGGDSMESNVVVWHTTEGTSLPSYSGGTEAPNFTAKPDFAAKVLRWYQHFDFDTSSRALVHAGAVATNTLNVSQVELVATCDPATHAKWTKAGIQHLYTPELPDWVIRDLAAFAKWAHDQHGVPLTSGVTFKPYPGSYGTGNGVRMSNAEWLAFKGHCGHQHVPSGNLHGDPGAFPMAAILTAAKGGTIPNEEDPMAGITKKDIFDAVWKTDAIAAPSDAPDVKTNQAWQPQSILRDLQARIRSMDKRVAAMSAAITALASQVGKGADTAIIVAAVESAIEHAVIDVNINSKDA